MKWFQVDGDLIEPELLKFAGAQGLRDALAWYPLARLVEVRAWEKGDGRVEVVVFDVEPELPQDLVHDIRSVEQLAVMFAEGSEVCPTVIAMRKDFPSVPHLNWTPSGGPKNLCLYEDAWSEVRLRWTGAGFLREVLQWLSHTATGELHGEDQALEPFLFESTNVVVFPENVFDESEPETVYGALVMQERERWPYTLMLRPIGDAEPTEIRRMYCASAVGKATKQEAMRDCPRNMEELKAVLGDVGVDLWAVLGARVKHWYSCGRSPRNDDGVVLVIRLPRQREASGAVETVEHLAFEIGPMQELALATGRVGAAGVGEPLVPLVAGEADEGLACLVNVVPLRAVQSLDRRMARHVSGLDPEGRDPKVVLVGVGALGSQIHNHLSRMGWGRWTVIDKDTVLPHNVPRHRLGASAVGLSKIATTKFMSDDETPYNAVEQAFLADAQEVAGTNDMLAAYRDADLILDASTSIAVARFLGRDLDSSARRGSLFLSPNGRDAVMLMEDAERSVTLDALEAQYYRAVLTDERLVDHIRREAVVRYSAGCRDVTARLAQDDVALASGLLCRQVRTVDARAVAAVWQRQQDGSVGRVEIPVSEVIRTECDEWSFVLDVCVVERAERWRKKRLPNETGGVLVGYFDVPRRCVYVVDALRAPADSVEHKTAFIRGYAGLREELAGIEARTGGQVSYVGEWHSHPQGAGVGASPDDEVLLATIAEEVRVDGWPGVMMIVGGNGSVGLYTHSED